MVQPGEALLNIANDFADNRRKIVQETIAVKQHQMMTDLQVQTIKKMDEDAVNLPAGQFNAERYMEEFNTQSANLLNQFEDKGSRLNLEQMTTQVRGQLGLKANQYELKSLQAAQKAAKENFFNAGIEQAYESYNNGNDVLEDSLLFFSQADALKPNLSFAEQQDLEEKKGDYAVITMNLRADQAMKELLNDNIDIDEYTTMLEESKRIMQGYPLTADQRVKVNDIFSSEQARMVSIATNAKVAQLKENFDGYKTELIRTGKFPKGKKEEYAKAARLDSSLLGFLIEIDVVEKEQTFYAAREKGDLKTMEAELNRARQQVAEAKGTGKEFGQRDQAFQKLNVDYEKALAQRDKNFADFYKNDPRVKILKMQGLDLDGDMRPYVSYIQALAAEQGLDPSEITLLDEDYKQLYKERLSKAGRDVKEARKLALDIDRQYGQSANRVFSELLYNEKDPKLNAFRYRNDPAFAKIWLAATMDEDEIAGKKLKTGINPNDAREAVVKDLKDFHDTRISEGDIGIGSRIKADAELGYRMQLNGLKTDEVSNIIANREYNFIKKGDVNIRIPKDRGLGFQADLSSKLRDPGFKQTLIAKNFSNLELANIPFSEADLEQVFSKDIIPQPVVAGVSALSPGTGIVLDAVNKRQKNIKDLTEDTIKDILFDSVEFVNDGDDGIKLVVPTIIGGESLERIPLRDKQRNIIRYTWDQLQTEKINLNPREIR